MARLIWLPAQRKTKKSYTLPFDRVGIGRTKKETGPHDNAQKLEHQSSYRLR